MLLLETHLSNKTPSVFTETDLAIVWSSINGNIYSQGHRMKLRGMSYNGISNVHIKTKLSRQKSFQINGARPIEDTSNWPFANDAGANNAYTRCFNTRSEAKDVITSCYCIFGLVFGIETPLIIIAVTYTSNYDPCKEQLRFDLVHWCMSIIIDDEWSY